MHIPDGFIPLWQCAIYWIIALIALGYSLKWARENLDEKNIPLLAVLAAGIFAIQAMNVPIPWGTSGHMVGAALIAIVFFSPWAAVLVLSIVLILQGLIFGDGGITVMGANIVNMGIIGGFVGFYGYKALKGIGRVPGIFIAAWASIFIASIVCAIELALAGTFPLVEGIIFMGLYHAVIGVIEGVISVVVILGIDSARPDLLADWVRSKKPEALK
ncbi:MAG: cobalt transporter CbiM [Methanomicrobiales archaeon]